MLKIIIKTIRKIVNIFGYNIIRIQNFKMETENYNELSQNHIKNLRIISNRTQLLDLLPKKGIVAELGVDKGDFSQKIFNIAKPDKLFLIDSWDSSRYNKSKFKFVKKRFENQIYSKRIIIRKGKSEEEMEKFQNNYFDWIYIDTTHSFIQTVKELELCRIKVKDGGLITGHDYCQGNISDRRAYGVVQAVNQFCIKYNWEFLYLTHETDRILSFAIRQIE